MSTPILSQNRFLLEELDAHCIVMAIIPCSLLFEGPGEYMGDGRSRSLAQDSEEQSSSACILIMDHGSLLLVH